MDISKDATEEEDEIGKEMEDLDFNRADRLSNLQSLLKPAAEVGKVEVDEAEKEYPKEDKLSWEEIKKESSVNLTKDIKRGSDVSDVEEERSITNENTNLQGKPNLFLS